MHLFHTSLLLFFHLFHPFYQNLNRVSLQFVPVERKFKIFVLFFQIFLLFHNRLKFFRQTDLHNIGTCKRKRSPLQGIIQNDNLFNP